MSTIGPQNLASLIWQVADLLRGDYKPSEYGKVILPFTVLRRFECVLETTKSPPMSMGKKGPGSVTQIDDIGNSTGLSLAEIGKEQDPAELLHRYIGGFTSNIREVFEHYRFKEQIHILSHRSLLRLVLLRFSKIDLHPDAVSNHDMGYAFEELIRRFSEESNETAGDHFTPREVVKLMAALLVAPDARRLRRPGIEWNVYDPACGTGGMLTTAADTIREYNNKADIRLYGQELNAESWAICRSDLMIRKAGAENVKLGNTLSDDQLPELSFDYALSNPPFGVEWKKVQSKVRREYLDSGYTGRFGAGLPRINDGSLLFLQHMISKMREGARIAVVLNGSPLFSGSAGSGESEIRRWLLENDLLEAVVALPDQIFYNTGISTYIWTITNRKSRERRNRVALIDARAFWTKMPRSLGDKRRHISEDQIQQVLHIYKNASTIAADPTNSLHSKVKIFSTNEFGYQRITIERPLRLRFQVTEETLVTARQSKPFTRFFGGPHLEAALKPLLLSTWSSKLDAWQAVHGAIADCGLPWPTTASLHKVLRDIISVRHEEGEIQTINGVPEADPALRDYENLPLNRNIADYARRELTKRLPDAWVDETKTKVGYEIPFTRYFFTQKPIRPLRQIDAELHSLGKQLQQLLRQVIK